jgi:hypothetical protein
MGNFWETHNKQISVPEIIDPVFAKTSPKRPFCMTENERFGLVSRKRGTAGWSSDVWNSPEDEFFMNVQIRRGFWA